MRNMQITSDYKNGIYVDVKYTQEAENEINKIIKDLGLKKDFNDNFHITITYSKEFFNPIFPFSDLNKDFTKDSNKYYLLLSEEVYVTIKSFGHFDTPEGKNLHVVLDCDFCKKVHDKHIKAGAKYDFDKYIAHSTLLYNCKDFDVFEKSGVLKDSLKKYIGKKLQLKSIDISPLNENWVEDSQSKNQKSKKYKIIKINDIKKRIINDIKTKR